jgi:NAD+ kinase
MTKRNIANTRSSRIRFKHRKIGFVIKHHHPEAAALAVELADFIIKHDFVTVFADESRTVATSVKDILKSGKSRVQIVKKAKLVDVCDLIIVLGGDGTYLSIARLMRDHSVPVLGVNMGQLGFLTEIKRTEVRNVLNEILEGAPAMISERALLEVTLTRKNKVIFQGPVVNDAVVSKGAIARIIDLEIAINGVYAHSVRADGIIVSTPTGSTAYSLAAGGPIIEPQLSALVLAAICPHSLTQRPLVIPDSLEVKIHLKRRPGHVLLTLDGQDAVDMKEGDFVTIRRFKKHSLKLISSPTRDYFNLLREKLKFGMRD